MDNLNVDRKIRNNIEINPAEKGEVGSSIEQPKSFNATESSQEASSLITSSPDELLITFVDAFQKCILAKDVEKIFASFSKELISKTGNYEEFQKFYNNSEVIAHIASLSLDLKRYDDNQAIYAGTAMTDVQKEYPAELKVQKENEEWKISEIGFGSIPVK